MKKANINFSGLVSVTREVCGVEVRGLNFSDISKQWQTKGKMIMDAYDRIVKDGASATNADVLSIVNDVVAFAPDLARDMFLAAIDDDGVPHEAGIDKATQQPIMLTAAEVWENYMGIGKQIEVLVAILELTVSESDVLKKSLAKLQVGQTQQAVMNAMS